MDALEAFTQIVGFWPSSFKPRETWRDVALEELQGWSAEERSGVVRALQAIMGKSKTVDIETLRRARSKRSMVRGGSVADNTEAAFFDRLGLAETLKSQHISDRVMISRLIKTVMRTPGWEAALAEQAGSKEHFKPWERIENLLRAADKATIEIAPGKYRKACYPSDKDGWTAPTEAARVHFPQPRSRVNVEEDKAGLARISAIASMYGGFNPGNTSSMSAIYNSPEYQKYLKDYTDRTGLQPA